MRTMRGGVLAVILGFSANAWATDETCGDGADNNANAQTDEGCSPTAVTGVCESSLDCAVGGAVGPKLGALVYPVLPDVTPIVAYGPGIPFQRTYTSQYAPGYAYPSASTYRNALGYRWQHNYMSWLERFNTPSPDEVVLHTVDGRDVLFTYASTAGGYDYFTPQVGAHYVHLRQETSGHYDWQLKLLTGEVYLYDGSSTGSHVAKLTAISDTLASPNYVNITYNGDGKIDQVTNAGSTKYLQFEYFSTGTKLLQYVKYYADSTLQLTVEFTYSSDKLASAKLGSTTVESYAYDGNGYLTDITDGGSKTIAAFTYLSTAPGKVIRAHTGQGDVGYEYSDAACSAGETGVYYHRYDTNTCTTGATGYYCGGKDAGGTGRRYKVRRCLTFSTANEHVVTDVAAVTYVSGASVACASCVGTQHYDWYTNGGAALELRGTLSADSVKTSYEYNANGLVVTKVENDDDYDATDGGPGGSRVTYYTYTNGSFPGRVTEVRIKSELQSGTCNAGTTTACKRTLYTYNGDGLMSAMEEVGWTYNTSGAVTAYDYTTGYTYDGSGRITQLAGPLPNASDNIDYTYWAAANGFSTDYLKEIKRRKDDSTYVTTTLGEYDFWGHPLQTKDPNSKLTCRTSDASYGTVTATRVLVGANQDDCGDTNGDDETTTTTYDTHRRVTKVTKPRGNCNAYTYDSDGRLSVHLQANHSGGACDTAGDTLNYTYSDDGLVTKQEWKNAYSTVTRRQEYTYGADRRRLTVVNPVDTNKAQTWTYDADGVPAQVEWEDYGTSNARTAWDVDALNRKTAQRRYTGASTNEAFAITPGVQLDLPTVVTDPLSHIQNLAWDDLGRQVKLVTAEGGTNLYYYDAAGDLKTKILSYGDANATTTEYTYDYLHRLRLENPGDAACAGASGDNLNELQYVYDALGGASCPSGSSCSNLAGHLAYVKTQVYCAGGQGDKKFDQFTYYSYTDGGRVAEHTVEDDAGRKGRVVYTYNKNGEETRIDYPTGASTGAVYDYGPWQYGDESKVIAMKRDSTTVVDSIKWKPFGPLYEYRQMNNYVHSNTVYPITTAFTYNVAYRAESIWARSSWSTPDEVFKIAHAEDARGRYTQRDLSYGSGSDKDMFFLYDNLNRVTCRSPTSQGTCQTSGGNLMENIVYNTSSDRTRIILQNNLIATTTFTYNYVSSTSDRIDCISMDGKLCGGQDPSATKIAFTWDSRGNRLTDNDQCAPIEWA